ncbi:MAG: YggT family protein [Thiotrichales bacterium]|nr:YggT family protein [Thiotrichales bacterium]
MDATTPLGQGGLFFLQFVVRLVLFGLMLRFLMRATYADWRNPIVTFIAKATNPLCAPANKLLPTRGRWDWAAIITALVLYSGYVVAIGVLTDRSFGPVFVALEVLNQLLDMLFWLIVIQIILSWVSPQPNPNTVLFQQLTEPVLEPFRRLLPATGGFDFSPILAILAIKLVQIIGVGSLTAIAQGMIGGAV